MARDEIAQRLPLADPTSGGAVASALLPAVRYATRVQPDAAIDVAQSKFGGAPDLPQGTVWPMWTTPDGERRALQFFAQLDLAEAAAAAPAPLGLPDTGQLSFFADFSPGQSPLSDPVAATILYSPASSFFVRCVLRMVPLPTAQVAPIGAWTWPRFPAGVDLDAFDQEYEADVHSRAPHRYEVTGRHQLGGHRRWSPEVGADRFTVLQIDADKSLETAWGAPGTDAGLVWSIDPADVAAGDWAAVRFSVG